LTYNPNHLLSFQIR